jgi:putative transcriptional regulator
MKQADDTLHLTGKLLIAMPGMGDPRFDKSVVFLCVHSEDGAMGLIVNKPTEEMSFSELLEQLSIESGEIDRVPSIYFGGPVELGRGFVLHSGDYQQPDSTLKVDAGFGMTASLEVLEDLAQGTGPDRAILALGYAGWGPGQLEGEIAQNGWLISDATHALVFSEDDQGKWAAALKHLGIDPLLLSSAAGRA